MNGFDTTPLPSSSMQVLVTKKSGWTGRAEGTYTTDEESTVVDEDEQKEEEEEEEEKIAEEVNNQDETTPDKVEEGNSFTPMVVEEELPLFGGFGAGRRDGKAPSQAQLQPLQEQTMGESEIQKLPLVGGFGAVRRGGKAYNHVQLQSQQEQPIGEGEIQKLPEVSDLVQITSETSSITALIPSPIEVDRVSHKLQHQSNDSSAYQSSMSVASFFDNRSLEKFRSKDSPVVEEFSVPHGMLGYVLGRQACKFKEAQAIAGVIKILNSDKQRNAMRIQLFKILAKDVESARVARKILEFVEETVCIPIAYGSIISEATVTKIVHMSGILRFQFVWEDVSSDLNGDVPIRLICSAYSVEVAWDKLRAELNSAILEDDANKAMIEVN